MTKSFNTCLLIPHFNNPKGLLKSITSIGKEEEIDICIVDDGSEERFDENEIRRCFQGQGRVIFINQDGNYGIEIALNKGLERILQLGYKYVARLDCNDLASANRFSIQMRFLESNPDIAIVGSWATAVNTDYEQLFLLKFPTDHETICKKMYFNSMFLHPTVMFKTDVIKVIGYYPTNYPAAEDYAYFFEIMKNYVTANIPESLVQFTVSDNGISAIRRRVQISSRIRVIIKHFYLGYYPLIGLVRNILLMFLPAKIVNQLKSLVIR